MLPPVAPDFHAIRQYARNKVAARAFDPADINVTQPRLKLPPMALREPARASAAKPAAPSKGTLASVVRSALAPARAARRISIPKL